MTRCNLLRRRQVFSSWIAPSSYRLWLGTWSSWGCIAEVLVWHSRIFLTYILFDFNNIPKRLIRSRQHTCQTQAGMKPNVFAPDAIRNWQSRGQLASVVAVPKGGAAAQHHNSTEWQRLRAAMMTALQDYPEARDSLVRALGSLDALEDSHDARP